jgi:hypothetical protein
LGDDWVIAQIVPYLVNLKRGGVPDNISGWQSLTTEFAYFAPLVRILKELYYDFDIEGKFFPPERPYYDNYIWYDPQRHNNIPFAELYSENYLDFVRRYEEWIKRRFRVGLNRQPQLDDIIIRGHPYLHR